ncbi:MAG: signal recognition particle protein [Candidatus Altiarchaeales archaeon]|nr:signal recognition particle protein [Candidatus Altiarchaeales archaeon]MBD3416723.1 signal recognition particle protein [Candidatus Altiarchaeales archaeon]
MAFDKLRDGLQGAINNLKKAVVVDKKTIKAYLKDIQKALISADVNVKLVLELSKKIEDRGLLEKPPGTLTRKENLIKITYDELTNLLGTGGEVELSDGMKVMLVGVQGSGKTTTAAKLAKHYKKKGLNSKLICADTFRPAAYDQLKQLAEESQTPFYGDNKEKDTLKIIQSGLREFKNQGLIIVDSEGRHKLDKDLMSQINRIHREIEPDRTFLVLDGTIGQSAGEQAKAFNESCNIDGVIISKLDGSAKGGGSLAACAETSSPVYFIGVGEHIEDLEVFDPKRFVSKLLGFGDMEGLLEKAKEVDLDEESAKRMLSGKFTLTDVYQQIEQMQGMGSMDKIMEMLPFGAKIPKELVGMQEEKIKKFKYIMDSMTWAEKEDPSIIKKDRIERIAAGSGTDPSEVRELLTYYKRMKKMMKGSGGGRKMKQLMKQMGM